MKHLIWFTVFLFINNNIFAKTDLKSFSTTKSEIKEVKVEKVAPQKTKKQSALIQEKNSQDIMKLRESLKGLNLVLNNQPNSPNRTELLLKKSFLHVTIVRETGRSRTSYKQLTEDEIKHLTIAKDILTKLLLPTARLPENKIASVYYLLGLIAYEYEDYKLQQKYFIDALKIDPRGQQAGSLALMVAEQYFDDEDFHNALKYYKGFLNIMNDKQKDLALYKSAWCYISLQDLDKAEVELLKVIQSKNQTGFQKDSLRDLAFVSVRHLDELGIIRIGQQKLVNDNDRNEFYSLSLKYFFQMQTKQSLNRLISLVLKSEKKLEARLDILGHQVSDYRRDYMNPILLSYIQGVRQELEKNKKNLEAPELVEFRKVFQSDLEYFLYTVAQVYQATDATLKKSEIGISDNKSKVSGHLEKLILFYDYFFPESKNKILVYQLFSDLCLDSKSYNCVTQVFTKIKNYKNEDAAWNELRLKLRAQQLIYCDEMYIKDPSKNETLFLQTFNDFKKDFPNHELVLKGYKRTLQIHTQKSDTDSLVKNYSDIYQIEKTAENLYNFSVTVFKQEKYSEVIDLLKNQYPTDVKLNQLRIETYLKLAEKESKSENFKNYETHVIDILKINSDLDKSALIYSDWMQKSFSLKSGGAEHAFEIFNSIPEKIKNKPVLDSYTNKFATTFLLNGDFDRFAKINFDRKTNKIDVNSSYYKLIQFFSNSQLKLPNWTKLIQTLDAGKRNYLLGLLALVRPEMALEYFQQLKTKDENTADLYILALKTKNQSDQFQLSSIDKKILGKQADSFIKKSNATPAIVNEMKVIKFPVATMSYKKYNDSVEKLVPAVKKIREKLVKSFQTMSIEQKLLIVPEAEALETRTAKTIEEAPLPDGLTDVQKTEYRAGINELAKDFVDQAIEYKKMFDGLSDKMIEMTKQKASENMPEINMTQWIWPNNESVKKASALNSISAFQAHIYLDLQFAEKVITDNEHLITRVGLLVQSQNTEVMRNYIKQELLAQKKEDLVQKWKSLAEKQP